MVAARRAGLSGGEWKLVVKVMVAEGFAFAGAVTLALTMARHGLG